MQLTQLLSDKAKTESEILAVSVDAQVDSRRLIEKLRARGHDPSHIGFLRDENHRVIDRYGIFNDAGWAPIAHPSTFVIDKAGIVRWRFVETNYTVRAKNDDIVRALGKLD